MFVVEKHIMLRFLQNLATKFCGKNGKNQLDLRLDLRKFRLLLFLKRTKINIGVC